MQGDGWVAIWPQIWLNYLGSPQQYTGTPLQNAIAAAYKVLPEDFPEQP
jgi:hypothetical protein